MFWTYAYRALSTLALPFLVLASLLVPKWRAGLAQRLGFIPQGLKDLRADSRTPLIWIHAVSYGEVRTILPLVQALHSELPTHRLAISTGTLTGQKLAQELFREEGKELASLVFYAPFDHEHCVKSWFDFLRPAGLVLVETELWLELISEAQDRQIPCLMINARLTERSVRLYKFISPLLRPLMKRFEFVLAQSKLDRDRYLAIGTDQEKTIALGNLKLDGLKPASPLELDRLRTKLQIKDQDKVIVAGSTHQGEEGMICDVLRKIYQPNLKLILVPRHIERVNQIFELCRSYRFATSLISDIKPDYTVLIVDRMGMLSKLYGLGEVALLGGTWANVGGHNPLEPAIYGIPVLTGAHTYKITELVQQLQESNQIFKAPDPETLANALLKYLMRDRGGKRQNVLLNETSNISDQTVKYIRKALVKSAQNPSNE
ncbi:MAG: glycosyltransferase N-terminal domain-containing protein [Candidatus Caenarcaniphilales bacterium]|nr:glycosyltransferase N-terminal domain-containing protein [Candidatus Caenarcaniphilales bacterium]